MPPPPQRGDLVNGPPTKVTTLAPSDLLALLGTSDLGKALLQLAYTPVCSDHGLPHDATRPWTPAATLTVASGALMVPGGTGANCTGARPVVLYAHGTNTDRSFDISQVAGV